MDTDDFFFTDEANNGDHAERPAGEVPLATLAEGSNRRRTTAKSRTQQRRTDQDVSKIITQAAEEKPHHRDKVLRSLQTFTRAMMGLLHNAKPEELPASVTSEELASWDTWRERRKDAFSQRLKEATDKHPDANEQEIKHIRKSVIEQLKRCLVPVTFRGAHFAASSAVSIHVKKEMEANLAKHGFHRFTFDWNAPFVHDVLWNSVLVDITVLHWLPWAKRTNVDVAESSIPGIKTRFFQWITNQGLTRVKAQFFPAEVAVQRAHAQYLRSTKRKIATLRGDTFKDLYPARKILGHLLRDPDAVSDSEEDDANTLPRRRSPTAEEQKDKPVPARFPRDAYDTDYLLEEGEFQAEHLTTEAMDIEDLGKAFGAGYRSPADNGSARPPASEQTRPAPGNAAGPAGPEVQMSG
ncbi:hypothetical protein PSTT_11956 [Puccinia striiformis]|uniref:Uncharacterized protein n=1 Tax=Puccinia striiformis TaxID=27350 RepID=A0A2S4UXY8_9BASI|nr:hypothetical protein PSTT_11956 [Puccinia striiformis]